MGSRGGQALPLAERGDAEAQALVGEILFLDRSCPADWEGGLSWYRKAARQGNLRAMHQVGLAYAWGAGVEADQQAAARWFLRAAEAGSTRDKFEVGVRYYAGRGLPVDHEASLRWLLEAAAEGHRRAAYEARRVRAARGTTPPDEIEATRSMDAAAAGDADAQWYYANLYADGRKANRDPVRAYYWLCRAALSGHPEAGRALAAISGSNVGPSSAAPDAGRNSAAAP